MDIVRTIKALGDPLRLRVLAAVSQEELTVGEVQEIVGSVQSSVSRNLAILREAGFIQDRKEGTNVYFSARRDMPAPAQELFKSLRERIKDLPEGKGDRARLENCRRRKVSRSRDYFETVAGDWERIRKSYFDDRVASLAIEKLLPRNLVLADVGCGTGSLTFELARFARKVIGVDLSQEMLRRAGELAKEKKIANVDLRLGDALRLPIPTHSVDSAFCVMVLHFLTDPQKPLRSFAGSSGQVDRLSWSTWCNTSKNGCARRWRIVGLALITKPLKIYFVLRERKRSIMNSPVRMPVKGCFVMVISRWKFSSPV